LWLIMNAYKIDIAFKNGHFLTIDTDSEVNPQVEIEKSWVVGKREGAISIGKYIIDINDIAYIKVEGETLAEPIRE